MEFIELHCLCKRFKEINKKQQRFYLTNSCIELAPKFFPVSKRNTKNNSYYAVKFVERSNSSFSVFCESLCLKLNFHLSKKMFYWLQ